MLAQLESTYSFQFNTPKEINIKPTVFFKLKSTTNIFKNCYEIKELFDKKGIQKIIDETHHNIGNI